MSRASGSEQASRSSLVTTSMSPDRHAASASRSPGRAVGAREAVVDVDPLGLDAKSFKRVALRLELLRRR